MITWPGALTQPSTAKFQRRPSGRFPDSSSEPPAMRPEIVPQPEKFSLTTDLAISMIEKR